MGWAWLLTWAFVALPFLVTAATGGPDGLLPHAVFHPLYVLIASVAVLVLVRLRAATGSRVVRGLIVAMVVAQVGAIVGHLGEEVSVMQHGGLAAGPEAFDVPLHALFANVFTVPGLLGSQLLLVAATLGAARSFLRGRAREVRTAR